MIRKTYAIRYYSQTPGPTLGDPCIDYVFAKNSKDLINIGSEYKFLRSIDFEPINVEYK